MNKDFEANLVRLGFREYCLDDSTVKYYPMPDELDGYCCVNGNTIIISAVQSKHEHKGNLRRFLDEIESKFDTVKVPTPSPRMYGILLLRSYVESFEYSEDIEDFYRLMTKTKSR